MHTCSPRGWSLNATVLAHVCPRVIYKKLCRVLSTSDIIRARVSKAGGIAWPNHLAVFAMFISVSLVTTELVSLGGIGTPLGVLDVDG